MIRLVVFDLDGTLVDSSRDLADATNAMVAEFGGAPLGVDEVVGMVGEGAKVLVERALAAAGLDPATPTALPRFLAIYDAHLLEHTRPYPGIPDALEWLSKRVSLAVLTNKPSHATSEILSGLGLAKYFRETVGGDSPFGRKPNPDALLHLARGAGAEPAETLMVGDSAVDRDTARAAGTRICLARYGFGFRIPEDELLPDDLRIDSPLELVAEVERLL
ncbi:MAG TPA: HAD-IA family hydrolase [Vicinamibacterales bacterium]